jgi:hypothetical protein
MKSSNEGLPHILMKDAAVLNEGGRPPIRPPLYAIAIAFFPSVTFSSSIPPWFPSEAIDEPISRDDRASLACRLL